MEETHFHQDEEQNKGIPVSTIWNLTDSSKRTEGDWEDINSKGRSQKIMILYIKGSTKKFLQLVHTFSKVAGYDNNIQKSVTF